MGDQHQCSCSAFQRDRELCKHICWLLLKRYRVPRTNTSRKEEQEQRRTDRMKIFSLFDLVLWQRGLVEREINELLRGLAQGDDERNKSIRRRRRQSKVMEQLNVFFSCHLFDENLMGKIKDTFFFLVD